MIRLKLLCSITVAALVAGTASCVTTKVVERQQYAKLGTSRTFEHEFPVVWKAIEHTLRNHKVVERDPEEVDAVEMKTLEEREALTGWIYGRSNDKYVSYKVNGLPRKKFLQTRYQYEIEARRVMGGTKVTVNLIEQVERLNEDGSSDGYSAAQYPDTGRANELLGKIQMAILSAR